MTTKAAPLPKKLLGAEASALTFGQLKKFLGTLSREQLAMPVRCLGPDARASLLKSTWMLPHDAVRNDDGELESTAGYTKCDLVYAGPVVPKGTVFLREVG